jgi:hypothetical protein
MDIDTTEANDPYCLRPGEAEALMAGAPWRRLLVMGDSIAAGNGDPVNGYVDRSWADRLAASLGSVGRAPAYLNLGHIGARAAEVRERQLERALALIDEYRPLGIRHSAESGGRTAVGATMCVVGGTRGGDMLMHADTPARPGKHRR